MPAPTSSSAVELLDRLIATPVADRARVLDEDAASQGADAATTLTALIEHASRMTLAEAAKANDATDVLVNLADRLGTQLDRARARRARARALSYAGKFREALLACEEGLRLAEEAGSAIEAGRTRLASMHALGELGRLDEAIATGEAARDAFISAGEKSLAARADLNIGTAHQRRDDPATAMQCFDRARPLLLGEPMVLGPLDNNRGEALLAMNDFTGAEQAFATALATFQTSKAGLAAAIAQSNLADVSTRQGRLQRAMLHFEQARRALEGGASPAHLARLLAEQAEVMDMLGMGTEAIAEYERALGELDRLGLALEAARARTGLGTALLRLGRHAQAETALAAAATAFAELGHVTARARVDLLRAELAASNGRAADARGMAMRALATLHDRPAESAGARLLLGRLAMQSGRAHEAEAELNHALALASHMDLAPLLAEVLHHRGLLRRADKRLSEAVDDLTAAVQQVERIRGALQAERFRAALLGDRAAMYGDLAATLLDRQQPGDIARAFRVTEQAKSRLLLEQMQRDLLGASESTADSQVPAPPVPSSDSDTQASESALLERLQRARADLNALYSVLNDERRDRAPAPASSRAGGETTEVQWRERVRAREREVDDIEARLATTAGNMGALFAETLTLEAAQRLVPPGAAMIEYFAAAGEIAAFVITADAVRVQRHMGSLSVVSHGLAALQFQINRALRPGATDGERGERLLADANRVLAELAGIVLGPLSDDLARCEAIIIIPHGALHTLPFHALRLNDRHLIETHAVSYAPSATLLAKLQQTPDGLQDLLANPLVVGVADEQAPLIAEEARLVADILHCSENHLLLDDAASVQRVTEIAPQASLLHLACHGRYAPDSPLGSGLRLADRWLTVRDLMRLRLRARLVTLSACETGLNLVNAGDELLGQMRGFFAAGAKSLIASLWRVDDSTTRKFMAGFYRSVSTLAADARTRSLASAVRHAQIALMRSHPHPAFWAPFILAGRP